MKILLTLFATTLFFTGCSSEKQEQKSGQENQTETKPAQTTELQSLDEWIRQIPVKSVADFDENHDGHVYNDNMCWNVIADVPGKCPKCGMKMKEVTISDAEGKLKEHGMME